MLRRRQLFSQQGEHKPFRRSTPFRKYNENTATTLPGSQAKQEPPRILTYIKPDFKPHIETVPGILINEPQTRPKRMSLGCKSQRFLLTSTEIEVMYGLVKACKAPLKLIIPTPKHIRELSAFINCKLIGNMC